MAPQWRKNHSKTVLGVLPRAFLLVVILLVFTVATVAWFDAQRSAATVTVMGKPSDLALVGPGEGELRLDMSAADGTQQEDGTIKIERVFGVKTRNTHWLEVAHTTNTKNFSFAIYKATQQPDGETYIHGTTPLEGNYLNEASLTPDPTDTSKTAAEKDSFYYGENFSENDKVQRNAIPLYWMSEQQASQGDISYYCLEVTWNETNKETDVLYIFASDSVVQ